MVYHGWEEIRVGMLWMFFSWSWSDLLMIFTAVAVRDATITLCVCVGVKQARLYVLFGFPQAWRRPVARTFLMLSPVLLLFVWLVTWIDLSVTREVFILYRGIRAACKNNWERVKSLMLLWGANSTSLTPSLRTHRVRQSRWPNTLRASHQSLTHTPRAKLQTVSRLGLSRSTSASAQVQDCACVCGFP